MWLPRVRRSNPAKVYTHYRINHYGFKETIKSHLNEIKGWKLVKPYKAKTK